MAVCSKSSSTTPSPSRWCGLPRRCRSSALRRRATGPSWPSLTRSTVWWSTNSRPGTRPALMKAVARQRSLRKAALAGEACVEGGTAVARPSPPRTRPRTSPRRWQKPLLRRRPPPGPAAETLVSCSQSLMRLTWRSTTRWMTCSATRGRAPCTSRLATSPATSRLPRARSLGSTGRGSSVSWETGSRFRPQARTRRNPSRTPKDPPLSPTGACWRRQNSKSWTCPTPPPSRDTSRSGTGMAPTAWPASA
mmetsp:Transcript_22753/g.66250  ORF Transcript_22753/g.66250 Transcript_22753/m.66250 type:complete len:250 (+) Transcript_22753:1587-2336(+)